MAQQATAQEMNRFVKSVDDFFANYAKLSSPQMRNQVYASGNASLIADYESALRQGRLLKGTIETTVGAWSSAKAAWSTVSGITSTAIGDAIDEIRSWFGYQPAGVSGYGVAGYDVSPVSGGTLGALGVIQLPAAAWVAGIVASALLLNAAMNKIFISVEASRIQKADPTMSRSQALDVASRAVKTAGLLGSATWPLLAAAALALYLVFGRKR